MVNHRFNLNLSRMAQPCVRVDAMVVSEIMDRLSPSMLPPMTQPKTKGKAMPVFSAIAMAMVPLPPHCLQKYLLL